MAFYRSTYRHIALVSHAVSPERLRAFVPAGLAIDLYNGEGRVSVLAKQVVDASILGIRLPDHQDFNQVSYQTYVKDEMGRRGILLLRQYAPQEITPKVLRLFDASEVFEKATVERAVEFVEGGRDHLERPILDASVRFSWKGGGKLELRTDGLPAPASFGPEESFLLSREWFFLPRSKGGFVRSRLEIKDWFVWDAKGAVVHPESIDPRLKALFDGTPVSSLFAKGSKARLGFPR